MKIQALFVFLALIFLTACSTKTPKCENARWFEKNDRLKILTTTGMIHSMVEKIGEGKVDSIPLITGELDPHSYELVKGDDEKFLHADAVFYNGLGLEHGLSLRQNLENNPKAFSVGDPLYEEDPGQILIVEGAKDPHIWLDISLWNKTIPTITRVLAHKDPKNADFYFAKAKELEKAMEEADKKAFALMQSVPSESRFLVTSHDAFNYFARRYLATPKEAAEGGWEKRFCAPEGLAPDAQLSLGDIRKILAHVSLYHIRVLFPESNVSLDSLKKITSACQKLNHDIYLCKDPLYGDAMGAASTYLEMVEHNVKVIAEHLKAFSCAKEVCK